MMDAVSRLDDAVALAAYVQCLARHCAEVEAPFRHPTLISENRWRAVRWGLDAVLVDLDEDTARRVPVARLVRRRLRMLAPVPPELGCEAELDEVRRILERGNGAMRQLLVYGANHDARDVARDIADFTPA
jgi:glutamate---cysteine ligase / carboxylate-amine ligase